MSGATPASGLVLESSNLCPGQVFVVESPELVVRTLGELRALLTGGGGEKGEKTQEEKQQVQGGLARRDDAFLLLFLRAMKFDPARAAKLLRKHEAYCAKHQLQGITPADFTGPEWEGALAVVAPRNLKDQEGRQVVLMDGEKYLKTLNAFKDEQGARRMIFCFFMRLLQDEATQRRGVVMIADMSKFSIPWSKLSLAKKLEKVAIEMIQSVLPLRLGKMMIHKETTFFWVFWKIVSVFMGKKLKSRVVLLGSNLEPIHTAIGNLALLPEGELGGRGRVRVESVFDSFVEEPGMLEDPKSGVDGGVVQTKLEKP